MDGSNVSAELQQALDAVNIEVGDVPNGKTMFSLPAEMQAVILSKLDFPQQVICRRVCREWNEVIVENFSRRRQFRIYKAALLSEEIFAERRTLVTKFILNKEYFSTIVELKMQQCGLSDAECTVIFQHCQRIEDLDVSFNKDLIGCSFMEISPVLKRLDISYCQSLKYFILYSLGRHCHSTLEELRMSGTNCTDRETLRVFLTACTRLRVLDVNSCTAITSSTFANLPATIESLNIGKCSSFHDDMIDILISTCASNLKHLTFDDGYDGRQRMEATHGVLFAATPRLESVTLSIAAESTIQQVVCCLPETVRAFAVSHGMAIGTHTIPILSGQARGSLTRLSLRYCRLAADSLQRLDMLPGLEVLDLTGSTMYGDRTHPSHSIGELPRLRTLITRDCVRYSEQDIIDICVSCTRLEVFHLGGGMDWLTSDAVTALRQAVYTNRRLRHIDISLKTCGGDTAVSDATLLLMSYIPNITSLVLEMNDGISDAGLRAVCNFHRLTHLVIDNCINITAEGLHQLARCLTLKYVTLTPFDESQVDGSLLRLLYSSINIDKVYLSTRFIKNFQQYYGADLLEYRGKIVASQNFM